MKNKPIALPMELTEALDMFPANVSGVVYAAIHALVYNNIDRTAELEPNAQGAFAFAKVLLAPVLMRMRRAEQRRAEKKNTVKEPVVDIPEPIECTLPTEETRAEELIPESASDRLHEPGNISNAEKDEPVQDVREDSGEKEYLSNEEIFSRLSTVWNVKKEKHATPVTKRRGKKRALHNINRQLQAMRV